MIWASNPGKQLGTGAVAVVADREGSATCRITEDEQSGSDFRDLFARGAGQLPEGADSLGAVISERVTDGIRPEVDVSEGNFPPLASLQTARLARTAECSAWRVLSADRCVMDPRFGERRWAAAA
jgi:hypothetical protein